VQLRSPSGRNFIRIHKESANTIHTVQTDENERNLLREAELEADGIPDGKDGIENTIQDTVQRNSLNNSNSEDVDGMDGIRQKSKADDLRRVRI